MLVRNALLSKGEDKYEEGKVDQAVAELKQKMHRWSQSDHGQVHLSLCICRILDAINVPGKIVSLARPLPGRLSALKATVCYAYSASHVKFQLCYAIAGGHVRFCILRCDDPDSCVVLSGDCNIYPMKADFSFYALLSCGIAAIQQTQVPSDAMPLGSELEFTSGTTITVMEDSVVKRVDHEKQMHLIDQLASFSNCTKQQNPASTTYNLKMVHTFASSTQSLYLHWVFSLGLGLLLSE